MPRKAPALPECPPPETVLGLLMHVAGGEMTAAAIPLLRDRLKLTPEKLALLLLRILNPDERIAQGEEATVRGIGKRDTLRELKEAKLFAPEINGILPPV